MRAAYEEILNGESLLRSAPDDRHERICARLHAEVGASIAGLTSTKLLPARTVIRISPGSMLRPDLALVAAATGKMWLAVEIINAYDHRPDTVVKKSAYEEAKLPRLWMIDPRYDNVEVYHGGTYGLTLKGILARNQVLEEQLLPGLRLRVTELFSDAL